MGSHSRDDYYDKPSSLKKYPSGSTQDTLQDEEDQIEKEATTPISKLKNEVHQTINENKENYIPVRERKYVAK